jgi:hypothetical protein
MATFCTDRSCDVESRPDEAWLCMSALMVCCIAAAAAGPRAALKSPTTMAQKSTRPSKYCHESLLLDDYRLPVLLLRLYFKRYISGTSQQALICGGMLLNAKPGRACMCVTCPRANNVAMRSFAMKREESQQLTNQPTCKRNGILVRFIVARGAQGTSIARTLPVRCEL